MKRILKGLGIGLAALAGLALLTTAVLYGLSEYRLNRRHPIPAIPKLTLSTDSATLAHGEHLAKSTGNCTFCHEADLGGEDSGMGGPLGTVAGPNLTRGRGGLDPSFSDDDWVRAIRYGVHPDGTSLIVMPSETFVHMNAGDLSALVSYLKQLPPIDREVPKTRLGFLGRMLLASGKLPILVAEKTKKLPLVTGVKAGPTVEYGRYLADLSGCRGCHGQNLSGGRVAGPPGTPPTSNLTPAGPIGRWTEKQFVTALRTGMRPNGTIIDGFMPWRVAGQMTDEELHAIWLYLKSVRPMAYGNR
ncbi:c-type cytochrome [Larkinella soli]|uniref:c-type cytochrome n=1 Tax=Larkinella soli TaxID=1770527 RepID=UPI000FFB1190|nr:c-type cytochrome [Larkinella soli]